MATLALRTNVRRWQKRTGYKTNSNNTPEQSRRSRLKRKKAGKSKGEIEINKEMYETALNDPTSIFNDYDFCKKFIEGEV